MSGSKIRELPPGERPREKLELRGPSALADAELLAILLRTGREGANAIDVARELIGAHGSLAALARCGIPELSRVKGVGHAKATQLVAAFGLGARLARETLASAPIDTPELVYDLLGPEMRQRRTEALKALLLDTRYRLIRIEEISVGSVNESIAHPREIFRPAIIHSAYGLIVAHNHPSGDPSPSQADQRLTRRLSECASLLQISLLDHVIIGAPGPGRLGYFSFKEAGLL